MQNIIPVLEDKNADYTILWDFETGSVRKNNGQWINPKVLEDKNKEDHLLLWDAETGAIRNNNGNWINPKVLENQIFEEEEDKVNINISNLQSNI